MKHTLYYIEAGDEENNLALMMLADTPEEAVKYWRAYYDLMPKEPYRLFRLPNISMLIGKGPLPWHALNNERAIIEEPKL